jgi:hypothetical protein
MAHHKKSVWFKNKLTGAVQNVGRGTPEHRRMITTVVEKDGTDEVFQVWQEIDPPKTGSTKYKSGAPANFYSGKGAAGAVDEDEAPAEDAEEPPSGPQGDPSTQNPPADKSPGK